MVAMDWKPLMAIAAMNLAAAMSPGPPFLLVTRTAAGRGRQAGLQAAAGTATASVSWAIAAVLGLQVLLMRAAGVYRVFQFLGGLYLCYVGLAIWRGAKTKLPLDGSGPGTQVNPFRRGLTLGLSNPKVIVFFGTIFTTAFTPGTPQSLKWAAVLVVLCIETLWYTTQALFFGVGPVQAVYQKVKTGLERVFGGLLILFGGKLVYGSRG
jgi:threonine/homoserine/homoserine lactone efflux protein